MKRAVSSKGQRASIYRGKDALRLWVLELPEGRYYFAYRHEARNALRKLKGAPLPVQS